MTTYTDRQKACIRDVLTSMECTAQWLENGCDPKEAAAEIRLAMSRLTVESTSPITGFSEPSGAGDVRGEAVSHEKIMHAWEKYREFPVGWIEDFARDVLKLAPSLPAAPAVDEAGALDEVVAWMNPNEGFVRDAFIWQQDIKREPQFSVPVYRSAPLLRASDAPTVAPCGTCVGKCQDTIGCPAKRASDAQATTPAALADLDGSATVIPVTPRELAGLKNAPATAAQGASDYPGSNPEIIEKALYCNQHGDTESVENWLDHLRERLAAPTVVQGATLTDKHEIELRKLILEYGLASVIEGNEDWPRQLRRVVDYVRALRAPTPVADSGAIEREVIEPLKEPVSIKKALLGGRNAHVVLSGGTGPVCAAFLVNIQLTGWSDDKSYAEGFVKGFNYAASWMQDAMLAAAKPVSVDAPTAAVDDGQGVPEEFKEWFRLEWSKYQDKAISDGMVTSMTWALKGYRAARTSMPERKALVDPEIHLAMIEATKRSISPGPSWHWARAFAKDIERRIATPASDSATPNETGEPQS